KGTKAGVATSDVTAVNGEARQREIARLLGDRDLDAALRHAAELLKTAGTTVPRALITRSTESDPSTDWVANVTAQPSRTRRTAVPPSSTAALVGTPTAAA